MFCLSSSTCIVLGLIHPLFLDCLLILCFCIFVYLILPFFFSFILLFIFCLSPFFFWFTLSLDYMSFSFISSICLFFSLVCLPFYIFFFYHIFLSMTKLHLSSLTQSLSAVIKPFVSSTVPSTSYFLHN